MRNLIFAVLISNLFLSLPVRSQEPDNSIRIFDQVVFYDGYRMADNPDKDLDDNVLRHSCSLYATRLSEENLDALGEKLDLNVTIKACCDNYDRIGNINLAFVEKGNESYQPSETPRIEIGRFITPFMNKNKQPNTVPYSYELNYLSNILRDADIRNRYDLWLEFELFGIPYAANEQVVGCAGRSDVFEGTLDFVTSQPAGSSEGNIVVPIVIKKPEYIANNLNNYNENATDEIGKTVKTYLFDVPEDVKSSRIVLITSNHGANPGGEEYNRRWHFVYFDDELVLTYRPGRDSCEPFRQYNTQANGIYGGSKRSDAMWQSFSNWCPGDVIDNRIIELEKLTKGQHSIRIEVPDAEFVDRQGDIPVSIYFHGSTREDSNAVESVFSDRDFPVTFSANNGVVAVSAPEKIVELEVFSVAGERVHHQWNGEDVDLKNRKGLHIVCVELANGVIYSGKVML